MYDNYCICEIGNDKISTMYDNFVTLTTISCNLHNIISTTSVFRHWSSHPYSFRVQTFSSKASATILHFPSGNTDTPAHSKHNLTTLPARSLVLFLLFIFIWPKQGGAWSIITMTYFSNLSYFTVYRLTFFDRPNHCLESLSCSLNNLKKVNIS